MMTELTEMAGGLQAPVPNKEPRQRSINVGDLYLTRLTPPWARPSAIPAYAWRAWVMNQPVALVCRETLIANLEALDWKITPRDMKYKEELEPVSKYYSKLIRKGGNYPELGLDYSGLLEWIVGDMLDLPFGGFAEVGRKGDEPSGRVAWVKPIDAGTMYPTLNRDFPAVQYFAGYNTIPFPAHAQSRMMWSPHPYLYKEGWGIAPPEKIYFALELLNRGDKYYANLLLDVPAAGILDLGDMEQSAAQEWINSFRAFLNDQTQAFKVPVLYEHNNKVEFIPFGKVPNDIMFDKITMKYAALVAAAYGMSLGDIGLQTTSSSGETLAGSIRQERRTRKTGFARVKAKWKSFVEAFLPDTLEFSLIDYDDELNVAMGRARLASATAFNILATMKAFSPQEIRSQTLQDGLISITIPDNMPPDSEMLDISAKPAERPGALGPTTSPSSGGEGEVRQSTAVDYSIVNNGQFDIIVGRISQSVIAYCESIGEDELYTLRSFPDYMAYVEGVKDNYGPSIIKVGSRALSKAIGMKANKENGEQMKDLKERIESGANEFLACSVALVALEAITDEVAIDSPDVLDYDYVVLEVKSRMSNLKDFMDVHVSGEIQELLDTKGKSK